MRKWVPFLFYLISLLSTFHNGFRFAASLDGAAMRMELIHRHKLLQKTSSPPTQLERTKDLLRSDGARASAISAHRRQAWGAGRRPAIPGQMPLSSAADYGTGQYLVGIRVGIPAQTLFLIADTSSDLTWTHCQRRCTVNDPSCAAERRTPDPQRPRRVFRSQYSSSFRTVPCSSMFCKVELTNLFSLTRCPTPSTPCAYAYSYADGSTTSGVFANETVTLGLGNGRKRRLRNVLLGCSSSAHGQSFVAGDGVLGMGYSTYSFATKATDNFGGKFSYCLVDHLSPRNVTSFLTLGQTAAPRRFKMHYTDLVLGAISTFYALNVNQISVGGVVLQIPAEVWDVNGIGGTIIDSGSSLTSLAEPAYHAVMAALTPSLARYRRLDLDITPLEYCFNSTGFDNTAVPRLVFHFSRGAQFKPHVKSYIIDAADGVKCLGFALVPWPGTSVIGNIMQQNFFWEFDLRRGTLGYTASRCN